MANLCGINQKIWSEAITQVKSKSTGSCAQSSVPPDVGYLSLIVCIRLDLFYIIYRMPSVKLKNGLRYGAFCNEFYCYLEKLSSMNGNNCYSWRR